MYICISYRYYDGERPHPHVKPRERGIYIYIYVHVYIIIYFSPRAVDPSSGAVFVSFPRLARRRKGTCMVISVRSGRIVGIHKGKRVVCLWLARWAPYLYHCLWGPWARTFHVSQARKDRSLTMKDPFLCHFYPILSGLSNNAKSLRRLFLHWGSNVVDSSGVGRG